MGFLDQIREALQPDEETANRYARLLAESNATPTGAMLQSDVNRGVLPGRRSAWAGGINPTEAAKLDRFAWGRQAGLGGVPVAAGYEAMKALGRAPGLSEVSRALFGDVGGDFFTQDETTSPASLGNVASYVRGAMTPDADSLPEQIRNMLIGRR